MSESLPAGVDESVPIARIVAVIIAGIVMGAASFGFTGSVIVALLAYLLTVSALYAVMVVLGYV